MKAVNFKNRGLVIAANLYFPPDFDTNKTYPAIISAHPVGGVKEQTASIYAEKLAEKGFITLTFDASYQGASCGEPRYMEDPYVRVEDLRTAVDYLDSLDYVDADRIGILGICGGGGYVINAAITDHRIKAVVGVSAVNIGEMYRKGWKGEGNPAADNLAVLDNIAKQRTAEAKGAEVAYSPWTAKDPDSVTDPEMREGSIYYHTARAQHPNSPSKGTTISAATLMGYDAFHLADQFLTQPLLVVAGSIAGTRWHSEQIVEKAASTQKEIVIVEGANHFDLYDVPEYVNPALDKIIPFFQQYL